MCRNPQGDTLICRFLQGIWLHTQREDGAKTSILGFTQRNCCSHKDALYFNTKVKVCSPDVNTDFFDIVAGVLQGDSLAPYQFIICLDYILWMPIDLMKENGFTPKKARSRWYPVQTITDADYANDIALLTNSLTQAESRLHNLEQAASDIGLHVNSNKTEYMCNIFTLNGGSWKLVDKITYFGSSISSIENDINMQLGKALIAINRLLIIWKSNL